MTVRVDIIIGPKKEKLYRYKNYIWFKRWSAAGYCHQHNYFQTVMNKWLFFCGFKPLFDRICLYFLPHRWHWARFRLTARLRLGLVPPGIVELLVLLLRQPQPLLLHLVDLLLRAERVPGHSQVVPQHGLLLPLPLGPRVLQLGPLCGRNQSDVNICQTHRLGETDGWAQTHWCCGQHSTIQRRGRTPPPSPRAAHLRCSRRMTAAWSAWGRRTELIQNQNHLKDCLFPSCSNLVNYKTNSLFRLVKLFCTIRWQINFFHMFFIYFINLTELSCKTTEAAE